jgi:membrane associated rhomboid family serine protease
MPTATTGYPALPPVIKLLLIANGLVFLAELRYAEVLVTWLALWPNEVLNPLGAPAGMPHFWPWQLITYGFLHGGLAHLLLNMYALWLFGMRLEYRWGSQAFALYYFTCLVGAALTQLLVAHLGGGPSEIYPTLGASGGVFGVLLAYGLTYPNDRLLLLFPPIPIKAKWFALGYGVVELVFGVTGTAAGVAHFAHLGGMLFGFLMLLYWRRTG